MRTNYFENYDEYQRNRIKHLIVKLVSIQSSKREDSINIANTFLKDIIKPSWFIDDIETVRDVYEYIEYTLDNWNSVKKYVPEIKEEILYSEDLISDKEKEFIINLLKKVGERYIDFSYLSPKYKNIRLQKPIEDLDTECISKKSYPFIKDLLLDIINKCPIKQKDIVV